MTVKLSQERKVRSLAKKTLGSTRVGRAMRLPGAVCRRGWDDIVEESSVRCLTKRSNRSEELRRSQQEGSLGVRVCQYLTHSGF